MAVGGTLWRLSYKVLFLLYFCIQKRDGHLACLTNNLKDNKMSAKNKKKRNNSLGDLKKVFALMFGLGLSLDTIEMVLTVIENAVVKDVETAKVVVSDLAILLSGRMPKGEREPVASAFVITAMQMITNDLDKQNSNNSKKTM